MKKLKQDGDVTFHLVRLVETSRKPWENSVDKSAIPVASKVARDIRSPGAKQRVRKEAKRKSGGYTTFRIC